MHRRYFLLFLSKILIRRLRRLNKFPEFMQPVTGKAGIQQNLVYLILRMSGLPSAPVAFLTGKETSSKQNSGSDCLLFLPCLSFLVNLKWNIAFFLTPFFPHSLPFILPNTIYLSCYIGIGDKYSWEKLKIYINILVLHQP